ncbi:MAG: hypothetical protein RIG61_11875 [Deltaproteobacteria bacterium]
MKKTALITITLLITLMAASCSRDKEPDFRGVKWGMSKQKVKKTETAELVKEGNEILTYRIGGESSPVEAEGTVKVDVEGAEDTRVTVEVAEIEYEYDLLYVFGNGKLGMIVVHLRDGFKDPDLYISLFRHRTEETSKKMGEPAAGVAEYGDFTPKDDPYSSPGEICEGKYALRHIWPTKNKKTNVSIELDRKKFTPEPDCNLSVFYESVEHPVDPELAEELHELL